jgi:hypothetical protein
VATVPEPLKPDPIPFGEPEAAPGHPGPAEARPRRRGGTASTETAGRPSTAASNGHSIGLDGAATDGHAIGIDGAAIDGHAIEVDGAGAIGVDAPATRQRAIARARPRRREVLTDARLDILGLLAVYIATRGLLLLAAFVESRFGHYNFLHELANWDGLWYREIANHGYPQHVSYGQTPLGFFPLYPLSIWVLEPVFTVTGHDVIWSASAAGVVISMIGGAVATYFVYRLAAEWWDRRVAFRAGVLFIMFPGSVVFSMVYSEGLLLPLAAACLFALQRRRWLLAGILAGCATAVQPAGLALVVVCAATALVELRRRHWRLDVLRQVSVAPLLSLVGISAFAVFLWIWTGTPLATYTAQHRGWGERTDALALVHTAIKLSKEIMGVRGEPPFDLNLVVGLIGAVLLVGLLVMVYKQRRRLSTAALVWTLAISFLALTSEFVPPNPRMLITAFPALMVLAYYVQGKAWRRLLWANGVLLVLLSILSFHVTTLRP